MLLGYFTRDPVRLPLPCNAALLKLVCVRVNTHQKSVLSRTTMRARMASCLGRLADWTVINGGLKKLSARSRVNVHVHAVSTITGENNV